MVAGVAAVIAIFALNIVVVGVKVDRAVTHARVQGQLLGQLPAGLQIGVNVPHQVAFFATQVTFFAEGGHAIIEHVVFIAAAIFTHVLVIKTGSESHWHQQLAPVGPAGIDTLVMTLHINHAAGMFFILLCFNRNRLVLGHFTLTRVHHHAQVVLLAQLTLIA